MSAADEDPPADADGLSLARDALAAARARARAAGARPRADGGTGAPRGRAARAIRRARGVGPDQQPRSGARPDDRDPQLLGTALDRLTAERGWSTELAVGGVLGRWDQVVGPDVAAHCTPESFEDGVLVVRTDSTAWATQVRLLAPTLVRRLAEEVGHDVVHKVVVRGPVAPRWRKGGLHVRGRGPRDTYG